MLEIVIHLASIGQRAINRKYGIIDLALSSCVQRTMQYVCFRVRATLEKRSLKRVPILFINRFFDVKYSVLAENSLDRRSVTLSGSSRYRDCHLRSTLHNWEDRSFSEQFIGSELVYSFAHRYSLFS